MKLFGAENKKILKKQFLIYYNEIDIDIAIRYGMIDTVP